MEGKNEDGGSKTDGYLPDQVKNNAVYDVHNQYATITFYSRMNHPNTWYFAILFELFIGWYFLRFIWFLISKLTCNLTEWLSRIFCKRKRDFEANQGTFKEEKRKIIKAGLLATYNIYKNPDYKTTVLSMQ